LSLPGTSVIDRAADEIHRVVQQEDGGFAVQIVRAGGTRVVPGFPTSDQAQQWIDRALGHRAAD